MEQGKSNHGIYDNGFVNFTEFFKEEKDVWIRNIGNTNISLEFDAGNGNKIGECIPVVGDPINLSQRVPWDAIKNSAQFRNMVNRSPRILLILLSDQAMKFYRLKAERNNQFMSGPNGKIPDVAKAMEHADQRRKHKLSPPPKDRESLAGMEQQQQQHGQNFAPPESVQELNAIERGQGPGRPANLGDQDVRVDEIVNPRVLHLCQQVSYELPPESRMPARELLEELDSIRDTLSLEDVNHIMSYGGWPTVKNWARELAKEIADKDMNYDEASTEQQGASQTLTA